MKVSEAWLRTWANPELDTDALVEQLSVSGLEVDDVEPVIEESIAGVVIGEVLEAVQHPNADRLRVCTVTTGGEETVEIALLADNPGKWMLHCHMLEHQASGMGTWFEVA